MEEEKTKKKLTLSVSSKAKHSSSQYTQSRGKTSVVIEKKTPRRWVDKKFQTRGGNVNKNKLSSNLFKKKAPISTNFDIRKMAEERATRRFKNIKEDILQQKKVHQEKKKVLHQEEKRNLLYPKL